MTWTIDNTYGEPELLWADRGGRACIQLDIAAFQPDRKAAYTALVDAVRDADRLAEAREIARSLRAMRDEHIPGQSGVTVTWQAGAAIGALLDLLIYGGATTVTAEPGPDLIARLTDVCAELERNGWHVDPIDPTTPDTDLLARYQWEQTRLAVYRDELKRQLRAINETP